MAATDFLKLIRWSRTRGPWAVAILTAHVLVAAGLQASQAVPGVAGQEPMEPPQAVSADLPDAERYRNITLLLMVADGTEPALRQALVEQGELAGKRPPSGFPMSVIEDFQTPLNRIVDQSTLLYHAGLLFAYAEENRFGLLAELDRIVRAQPDAVLAVDLVTLAEDAIIARSAITSTLEFETAGAGLPIAAYLPAYRARTVYLRNTMEYWAFDRELEAITDQAMAETGGRMDAYQRLLEDKPSLDGFNQHLKAVERIYRTLREGREKDPEVPGDEFFEDQAGIKN